MRFFFFFLFISVCSCLEQDDIAFTSNQLSQLLSSDSAKCWVLTNRITDNNSDIMDCEKDDMLTFINPLITQDSNIFFRTGPIFCPGQTDSVIYGGTWQTIDTSNHQLLMVIIDGDSTINIIDNITSQYFTMTYQDDGRTVTEDYVVNQ